MSKKDRKEIQELREEIRRLRDEIGTLMLSQLIPPYIGPLREQRTDYPWNHWTITWGTVGGDGQTSAGIPVCIY